MAQRTSFATIVAGLLLMGGWLVGTSSGQTITTVAGGYTGDGGPASDAKLDWPSDVFVDGVGNIYIADYDNGLVRKIDAVTGDITTVAGGGNTYDPPYGDGGAATDANVPNPEGVFVDGGGNIYIADPGTGRIRKVDGATGTITTVAGGGSQYNPPFGDGGPAMDAVLANPAEVFADGAGNLYIADRYHYQIRKVDAATGIITTVAGNGSNTYSGDGGLATAAGVSFVGGVHVDGTGNIYLTDINAAVVRKVDTAGIITTVAGGGSAGWPTFGDGGSALDAQLQRPSSVAVDADGNIYIGEDYRVRKVDIGGIITTVAGGGNTFPGDGLLATQAQLGTGNSVYVDGAGNIYIGDKMNNRVCKVDAGTGIITTLAGGVYTGDGGPATNASFQSASDVSLDGSGNIYVADGFGNRIRKVDVATGIASTLVGGGGDLYSNGIPVANASVSFPQSVFSHPSGDIYLIDQGNRVRRVEAATGNIATVAGGGNNYAFPQGDGGPATEAVLSQPSDLYVDGAGNIYVADTYNHRIRKVDASTGNIETIAGDGNPGYSGDGGPATSASLSQPVDVQLDAVGNLYIAEMGNRVVRKVDASGNISTVAGGGTTDWPTYGDGGLATQAQLYWGAPRGIYVDGDGDLFIAEQYKIRKVNAVTGIINTVAGSGQWGFGGDGGSALQARFNEIEDVVFSGNYMYIADARNDRVRRVDLSPFISESAPASGLSGTTAASPGVEVKVFSIGLTGDGEASLSTVTLTLEDLSVPTGLSASDFSQLKLYRSDDAFLGPGDTEIGSVVVSVGSPTVVAAGTPDAPPLGTERFYLVAAVVASDAAIGHAFRVSFADGSVSTSLGGRGTGFFASDASRIEIAPAPIITTVAGNGVAGYAGEGSFAVEAQLNQPNGQVVVDGSGNIYFSDEHSRIFRKVDGAGGLISRIAGQFDYWDDTGDGGLATDATFKNPHGIAVDSNGNLYLSDWNTSRVRKVDAATGIITTVAGDGTQGYSGDGGPGASAQLMYPHGLYLDEAGNYLYIADVGNQRIRKLDLSSGTITTIAGDGTQGFAGDGGPATGAQLSAPHGVAGDAAGNLYIADRYNQRIRKVDAAGIITTVAGNGNYDYTGDGGPALAASVRSPVGIWADAAGNLYIADTENHCIRKVDVATGIITTVAGNGAGGYNGDQLPATAGQLNRPQGVFVDGAGNIFITDADNYRVRKVVVSPASLAEITPAAGLSGATIASRGHEAQLFSIGLQGNGTASLTEVTLTLSDLSAPTGLVQSDLAELKLYRSADAALDPADVLVGSVPQASINIGGPTTITATTPDTPPGVQWHYIIAVAIAQDAVGGHALKVGFPSGGVATTVGSRGTDFAASDADYVEVFSGVVTAATPTGSNVLADLVNPETNTTAAALTFASVIQAGQTSLAITANGPATPAGFAVGNPATYYDLATTAVFTGAVGVCFDYTGTSFADEAALKLLHYTGSAWVDITTSLDINTNQICGSTETLSPFAVFEAVPVPVMRDLRYIAQGNLPAIDGDISEWETLFGAPHLAQADFLNGGSPMDEADQKVEVWMGWNEQTDMIYVAARVTDNAFGTTSNASDPGAVWQSDDMEFYIDADNSGGYYDAGNAQAQQYILNPGGTLGVVLFPLGLPNPPQAQAAVQRNGTVYTYEMAIPGWELIDFSGNGTRHAFQKNEVIGLELAFADFESNEDATNVAYHAFNALDNAAGGWQNADVFSDFRLVFPEINTSEPTPAGDNITSSLIDPETGITAASLTFDNVTQSGTTELTTTSEGPPAPAGFQIGDPPITYELTTTAVFAGSVGVCFDYTGISFADESLLKLFHYEIDVWNDVTTSLDVDNDLICGSVTSLSPFGLFQQPAPPISAITGSQRVNIGQEASIAGDVYSGGNLKLGQGKAGHPGLVAGSLAAIGDVGIGPYNHITGDVKAGGRVRLPGRREGTVAIDGTISPQAAVESISLPPVSLPVDTRNAPDIHVKKRKTRDLAPNDASTPAYGALKADQDAQVTLHSGAYCFRRIDLKANSSLTIQLQNADPLTVKVAEVFRLERGSKVVIQGGDASQVLFEVAGISSRDSEAGEEESDQDDEDERSSLVGRLAEFAGTLYMPQGRINVNERAKVNGALIGHRVRLGRQVAFTGDLADHLDLHGQPPAAKPAAEEIALPRRLSLEPNYPNPFNPETTIRFELPQVERVRLEVYSVLGQKVRTLIEGELPAGTHAVRWDGRDESGQAVSSGVYFYRLEAGALHPVGRMLLLR